MPVKPLAVLGLLLVFSSAVWCAEVEVEDLRPGLTTTFTDKENRTVVRLEPTVALNLKAGEAAHPILGDGGSVRWEGYLKLSRAGAYRFSAWLRGKLRVSVAGKEVIAREVKGAAERIDGPEMRLEAGVHAFVAEFDRLPGAARVELYWQAPHFRQEPLPHNFVGHVPDKKPGTLAEHAQSERGRFLAEEHNCTSCHKAADNDAMAKGLAGRRGPHLTGIGQRAYAGWIYHWLEAPQKVRPGATMPQLFSDDEPGQVERYAVTRYLASLGGPLRVEDVDTDAKKQKASILRGQQTFSRVGCIACHGEGKADDRKESEGAFLHRLASPSGKASYPLGALGSQTTVARLAAYLMDPLAVDPSGRMPHMLLNKEEALDLARYLCQTRDPAIDPAMPAAPKQDRLLGAFKRLNATAEETAAFEKLEEDAQWLEFGKRQIAVKGCTNCHQLEENRKAVPPTSFRTSFADVKKADRHNAGCLTATAKPGSTPRFHLDKDDRAALVAFLERGTKGAGSPAPAYAARVNLQRFNCLACHSREGEGGIAGPMAEELRKVEKAENSEAVVPPPLTGVGHKLRTPWIKEVLTKAGRARPWMGMRMPQFGEANVGALPEGLARIDGAEPEDVLHPVTVSASKLDAGRHMVGKTALGCISCHDIAGVPNFGTRGPDLALMNQRVRYDWYRRWLEQPQRMQPGTRMPQVFLDGKSTVANVLDGSADAQAEAMWAYLSLGMNLPLPLGLEPPKGLVVFVKEKPELIRTFLPEAGNRALAIGYPGGISMAFDANTCRLAYAWSGNFLDVSPVWDGRGGNPAKVLGTRFWTGPPGVPWALGKEEEPPDFAAIAKDAAFGASLPDGQLFQGQRQLWFDGYTFDKDGMPTFRYHFAPDDKPPLTVHERPEPLRNAVANGIRRRFTLEVEAKKSPWLFAGETKKEPRLLDAKGAAVAIDLKPDKADVAATERYLLLAQGDGRLIVLSVRECPKDTRWRLLRQGEGWQALLQVPAMAQAGKLEVGLNIWTLSRDDPALVQELIRAK